MTKKALGPQPTVWPHPVVLVGANVDGKPDFAAVAWTGVAASNPPAVTIALQHHRYSLKGIYKNSTFSINIPSVDLVKETDYCGMISGAKTDKVADCKFKVFYGKLENRPAHRAMPHQFRMRGYPHYRSGQSRPGYRHGGRRLCFRGLPDRRPARRA